MELSSIFPAVVTILFFLVTVFILSIARTRRNSSYGVNGQGSLPPGPPGLPLVGNIFQLGFNPHHSLAVFSKTYGPIMSLKFGRLTAVVISSPEAAKEALKTHDNVLSARNRFKPLITINIPLSGFLRRLIGGRAMELSIIPAIGTVLFFLVTFFLFSTARNRRNSSYGGDGQGSLPPGPPGLPLVGTIFQLGFNPHRSLAVFSKTYGPIMSLKFGRLTAVVISSPEAAKEALKTHDNVLSARTFNDPVRAFDHHKHSVVWIPASARWRFLKKIIVQNLLSPQNLDGIQTIRMRKVEELVSLVTQFCERGEAIDMARASFVTAFNIISNALFSVDLATYNSNSSSFEFHETVVHLVEVYGKPNAGDFFRFLRFLDLQGSRKEATLCIEKLFRVFQEFIDDRVAKRRSQPEASTNDMLDALLDITQQNEEEFTMNDMKHLFLDVFVAGTDTNSSTVEWAMAELLRNPEKMVRAQNDIRQVIGENGVVQESDIPRLPYLLAIVKETLRLHPPAPLIPRKSESDVQIFGFLVPKNSQVFVNVWAMGQDPNVWENPKKFEPERFLLREIDVRGKDFELIPFGSGRRMCPGISMSLKTTPMVLASLLYSFDWKLQDGVVPGNMDMSEVFGLTLHKAKPLYAVPIKKPTSSS